jgi:hypothetical protein
LLWHERSALNALRLQHAINKRGLKNPVWLQMETSLAFRWIFSQFDIAGEKPEGKVLALLGENS